MVDEGMYIAGLSMKNLYIKIMDDGNPRIQVLIANGMCIMCRCTSNDIISKTRNCILFVSRSKKSHPEPTGSDLG
jgi:hypothetical protein